jgi:hypothetical protein
MILKEFMERNDSLDDKLDRLLYSSSLLDQAIQEKRKTGKTINAVTKKCKMFFESVPRFSEWIKLSDKKSWEMEVGKLYEEQNRWI